MLNRLCHVPFSTPIYALVDCDPDGLEILTTYQFGSAAKARLNDSLAVDRIIWLGVKSSEWRRVLSPRSIEQLRVADLETDAARPRITTCSFLSAIVIGRR